MERVLSLYQVQIIQNIIQNSCSGNKNGKELNEIHFQHQTHKFNIIDIDNGNNYKQCIHSLECEGILDDIVSNDICDWIIEFAENIKNEMIQQIELFGDTINSEWFRKYEYHFIWFISGKD